MSYIPTPLNIEVRQDASDRSRVSQLTTLFDGKTFSVDDELLLWNTVGTGQATLQSNKMNMSVIAGQYVVKQARFFTPYFSGKSQVVEQTFDNFALQAGVIKRFGQWSSNATVPYDSTFDGYYIESNGVDNTYYLVVVNNGVENLRLPWTQWAGYTALADYNWNNFTVPLVDFLWLGGAVLRFFVKVPNKGFVLAHAHDYAGTSQDVFMRNPQNPVRYEIRSTTGSGSFRAICSQVATEGSFSERGKALAITTPTAISAANTATTYVLGAVRKSATFRNAAIRVTRFGNTITSLNSRGGLLMLLLNPTLSSPLTWSANSKIEEAVVTNQTVTNRGRVLDAISVDLTGSSANLTENMLAELPINLDNTADSLVVAYQPASINQTVLASLSLLEY